SCDLRRCMVFILFGIFLQLLCFIWIRRSNLGHSDLLGWLSSPQIRVPETASANILHPTVVDARGAEASLLEFVGIKHHRRVTNRAVRRRFFSICTPKIVSPVIGQALSKAQNVVSL